MHVTNLSMSTHLTLLGLYVVEHFHYNIFRRVALNQQFVLTLLTALFLVCKNGLILLHCGYIEHNTFFPAIMPQASPLTTPRCHEHIPASLITGPTVDVQSLLLRTRQSDVGFLPVRAPNMTHMHCHRAGNTAVVSMPHMFEHCSLNTLCNLN
jgi:hypothetical protein